MSKIKCVILDWAGTAIDFGCMAPVQAFIDAFAQWDITITHEETRRPMGMAKRDHISTILNMPRITTLFQERHNRPFTETDIDEMYVYFEKILLSHLANFAEPKPFVLDTIEQLHQAGLKVGSSTGYNTAMMDIIIPAAREQGYSPDFWCCAGHVNGYGRPYPYMIFKNMEYFGIASTDEVIKVGDTEVDIQEAKSAGVLAVGIIDGSSEMGFSQEEWLALSPTQQEQERQRVKQAYVSYGADFVIQDIRELPLLIKLLG